MRTNPMDRFMLRIFNKTAIRIINTLFITAGMVSLIAWAFGTNAEQTIRLIFPVLLGKPIIKMYLASK